jgi:cobalt-zinc-cadmium efflux system outer membrane protein
MMPRWSIRFPLVFQIFALIFANGSALIAAESAADSDHLQIATMNEMPGMSPASSPMKDMPGMSSGGVLLKGMSGMDSGDTRISPGGTAGSDTESADGMSNAMRKNARIEFNLAGDPANASSPPLSLPDIEKLANAHNPTLVQAKAQIKGEKGKALQAGIFPNPMAGYSGQLMGIPNNGAGEYQGGLICQDIILGGKLRLSRQKYLARAEAAEYQANAQSFKVLNDVKVYYYRTLAAVEMLKMQNELLKSNRDRWLTVNEMFNLGEANQADRHLANANLAEQRLRVQEAENELQFAWENVTAAMGVEMPYRRLSGTLEGESTFLDWQMLLTRLINQSPQLGEARAKLKSDEITLRREKVQKIPNLTLGGGYGYDQLDRAGAAMAILNVTNIPLFNRNQGTVLQAEADLSRQQAQVKLVELQLRRQLADVYRIYLTALQHVTTYKKIILPELGKRYELMLTSYKDLRTDWPAVLETQRDFFRERLSYINHLKEWRESEIALNGFMLTGALEPPPGITPAGHIDATPTPR